MDNKMSEIIESSLNNIKSMVGADTVIGEPIITSNGTTIIPVSKVSVGVATGGIDYASKKSKDEGNKSDNNFGGGGGSGLTCSPVAFLVVSPAGKVDILSVDQPSNSTIDSILGVIDRSPEIISEIKDIFKKKN